MIDESVMDALMVSYEYNRTEDFMIAVYEDCLHRLLHIPYSSTDRTDEADIIFGTAVLLWGDYGTSPRYGWFDSDRTVHILELVFREHIKELERKKELDL